MQTFLSCKECNRISVVAKFTLLSQFAEFVTALKSENYANFFL